MSRTSHSWLHLGAGLLVLSVGLGLSGCAQTGTRVHNLNQLHADNGQHLRSGQLMTDFAYAIHVGFLGVFTGVDDPVEKQATRFDDPVKDCLENLILLGEFDIRDPRTRAVQIEWFARLAVEDAWGLSRQHSVQRLGRIGRDMGLTIDALPAPEAAVIGPDEARESLARLVAAVRPLVARQGLLPTVGFHQTPPAWDEYAEDAPPELALVCEQIDAMSLDLQGALRMLRAAALLEASTASADARVAPLRATIERLGQVCLLRSLIAALSDRAPDGRAGSHPGWRNAKVRGAALHATVQVLGPDALIPFVQTLQTQDDAVQLAALRLVELRGLPQPENATEDEWVRLRASWIESILRLAIDHANGQVRVRAMRALSTIRDSGSRSLSEDDWYAWWSDEVLPRALESASPSPSPPGS